MEAFAVLRGWPTPLVGVSNALAYVNLVVAIFNLVPAFPLDGGRMLRAALWYWRKDVRAATRVSSQMGSSFGFVLMVLGVIALLQGNIVGGMWWFLIGIFLRCAAKASYQRLILHEMIHREPVSRFMKREPVTVRSSISIKQILREDWNNRTVREVMQPCGQARYMVVDGDKLVGIISLKDVLELIALKMEIEPTGADR